MGSEPRPDFSTAWSPDDPFRFDWASRIRGRVRRRASPSIFGLKVRGSEVREVPGSPWFPGCQSANVKKVWSGQRPRAPARLTPTREFPQLESTIAGAVLIDRQGTTPTHRRVVEAKLIRPPCIADGLRTHQSPRFVTSLPCSNVQSFVFSCGFAPRSRRPSGRALVVARGAQVAVPAVAGADRPAHTGGAGGGCAGGV